MKHIFAAVVLLLATQAFGVSASFTLPAEATTSAGIYDANGVLVRTLWNNVRHSGGTHTATWNGLDDRGILRPNGQYELRVLSNNVQYTWEGVLGNTSENSTGPTVYHSLDVILGMAVWGSTVYFTTGYNEQVTPAFRTSTTNPHQNTKILGKGAATNHVTTDGTNVYWSATDPFIAENAFVYVTRTSDDAEASLSSATPLPITHGRTYTSAIATVSGTGAKISGLAVQKTAPWLFVSRRALNRLDVLNKSTGELVHTLTHDSPGALATDGTNALWMVTSGATVGKYSVATDGTLTLIATISSGLSNPLALAVSPDDTTLLIADGGDAQQLKAYSNTSTPSLLWTKGQAGGYANGPDVTNDKFYFRKLGDMSVGSDSLGPGAEWTYLAFQPDGKLWVGDPGNYRTQRFNADRTFLDRLQFLPHFYSVNVEPHDATRVFANFLEFSVDYSKPVGPDNGSWTLVRNWGWGVSGTYWDVFALLRSVTTLSNGRTYALLRNFPAGKMEVVELPAGQNLRFTGIQTSDLWYSIDSDGALRTQTRCDVPYNVIGTQIVWRKRNLTGFDSNNNPQWAPLSTVATSPTLTQEDVCVALRVMRPWEITSSGIVLAFGDLNTPGYHLQGLDLSTGQWKWKAAQSTHPDYIGPLPHDGHFDTGNNWFSPYAGGGHHATGRHIFWQYHGEGWKQGQTNKWTHLYDNGLVIGQFGEVWSHVGAWLPEAPARMAGNAFASAVVPAANGGFYIYHNDESQHGGLHRWHVTGLDTIHEDVQPITLSKSLAAGLQATFYDDVELNPVNAVSRRIDPMVDFYWGADAPPGSGLMNGTPYSVRWQGFVEPRYSELYTFHTSSDDGVRLWVNNELVVDNWVDTARLNHQASGPVQLEADKLYPITLEYYQRYDDAFAFLAWSSASQGLEDIPSSRLFFTDTSATFTGTNLHEGLRYATNLSDGLYGWQREPAQDVLDNWLTNWWQLDTSRYVYRRDLPADVNANFSLSGTASLTRDLRPVSATAVSQWSLAGKIAWGANQNRREHGQAFSTGHYLEVLDSAGKIIARMYPNLYSYPNIRVYGNSAILRQLDVTAWGQTLMDAPIPFEISAANGQITFRHGSATSDPVGVFDPTSDWQNPKTLRVFFFQSGVSYPQTVGLAEVTFSASP